MLGTLNLLTLECAQKSPGELAKCRHGFSPSGVGLKFCVSTKLPGPRTTLGEAPTLGGRLTPELLGESPPLPPGMTSYNLKGSTPRVATTGGSNPARPAPQSVVTSITDDTILQW